MFMWLVHIISYHIIPLRIFLAKIMIERPIKAKKNLQVVSAPYVIDCLPVGYLVFKPGQPYQ